MAEQTPLPKTYEAFDLARGEELDGVWAFSLSWALMMRDVEVTLVDEGLRQALEVVRDTQESPEQLFGAPREHAAVLYEQWRSEGRLLLDDDTLSWRDGIVSGLVLSAVLTPVFAVLLLIGGKLGPDTLVRFLGISLVIGFGSSLGAVLWSRRHRRPAPGPDVPADARWSRELTEILRSRYAMSGRRAGDIVAEAQAHAAESGRTVREEFGTPGEYAAHFTPDTRRRKRLEAAAWALIGVANGAWLLGDLGWLHAAVAVMCLVTAVRRLPRA